MLVRLFSVRFPKDVELHTLEVLLVQQVLCILPGILSPSVGFDRGIIFKALDDSIGKKESTKWLKNYYKETDEHD